MKFIVMPPKLQSGKSYRTLLKEREAEVEKQRLYKHEYHKQRSEQQKAAKRERDRVYQREVRAQKKKELADAKEAADHTRELTRLRGIKFRARVSACV